MEEVLYKKCTKCLELKSLDNFFRKVECKDGFMNQCKDCRNIYYKADYKKRPEYYKESRRLYRSKNPGQHRKSKLKKLYNISLEEYNELFNSQNGCCAICGKHQNQLGKILCVDHDHRTNSIRGLLCRNCNSGLGLFEENKLVLNKAIEYLCIDNYKN